MSKEKDMSSRAWPESFRKLCEAWEALPGIGPKTALKLTTHIWEHVDALAEPLADALVALKQNIKTCPTCYNLTEEVPCSICRDPQRDPSKICVVEEVMDLWAVERTGRYNGHYHVLGGALSPISGVGIEQLTIEQLIARVKQGPYEVILATNPTVEGEMTARYLHQRLKALSNVTVTRLAYGLASGTHLEDVDEVTISYAFASRRSVDY